MLQSSKMSIQQKKVKYVCPCCSTPYKIKLYYERHVSACELLHKSNKERRDLDEKHCEIPDVSTLYDMILTLARKNKELEEKIDELSHLSLIKKKQIHVNTWLNEHHSQVALFTDFMKQNPISHEDYERICTHDYMNGLTSIIKNMFPDKHNPNLPLKAFDQKENTLFIKKEKGWCLIQNTDLEGMIRHIEKQLMSKFVEWQDKNKHRMMDDRYSQEYTDILQKVLGNNFNNATLITTVRKLLYKQLKINLKNIIQFEFIV